MDAQVLADKLKEMYVGSRKGEIAVSIHLFGIKYASEITQCGSTPRQLAKMAGVPETYGTEINKGRKLARFVNLK
jgi:5-methylcytosine-specific restriction protein B